jgi:competence protein ComEA
MLMAAAPFVDAAPEDGKVNINTATAEQLQLLPRIGPALSQRIIEFREANGPFTSPDELVAVRGIGERSIVPMRPYLSTEGETTLTTKVRLSSSGESK